MIILEMFNEIEEIIISNKLGLAIQNLDEDWADDMSNDFIEEISIREFDVKRYSDDSLQLSNYNLKDILDDKYYKGIFKVNDLEKDNFIELSKKLISIQVVDYENTYLNFKNDTICNPTCEKEFEEKLIKFLQFIVTHNFENNSEVRIPNWIYSSEHSLFEKPQIIQGVSRTRYLKKFTINHNDDVRKYVTSLKYFGKIIDDYLVTENDFYKLDYLINTIYENDTYNALHLFKLISLIEMLLINPKSNGLKEGNFHVKLSKFLPDNQFKTNEEKKIFADIVRVIRNKIAHGNFISTRSKLEEYASKFMKNYWFDYIEYSRENWIYLNLCCLLNEIVGKIIWLELTNKDQMNEIRLS